LPRAEGEDRQVSAIGAVSIGRCDLAMSFVLVSWVPTKMRRPKMGLASIAAGPDGYKRPQLKIQTDAPIRPLARRDQSRSLEGRTVARPQPVSPVPASAPDRFDACSRPVPHIGPPRRPPCPSPRFARNSPLPRRRHWRGRAQKAWDGPTGASRMCHICRTQNVFPLGAVCAALWTYSEVDAHALPEGMLSKLLIFVRSIRRR
jgi:hypothetical protein